MQLVAKLKELNMEIQLHQDLDSINSNKKKISLLMDLGAHKDKISKIQESQGQEIISIKE